MCCDADASLPCWCLAQGVILRAILAEVLLGQWFSLHKSVVSPHDKLAAMARGTGVSMLTSERCARQRQIVMKLDIGVLGPGASRWQDCRNCVGHKGLLGCRRTSVVRL